MEVERLTAILAYRNDEATNNDNDGNQQIQVCTKKKHQQIVNYPSIQTRFL